MDDKERQKLNRKKRYYWLKEHHICVSCGKNKAIGEYVRCASCQEYMTIYNSFHKKIREPIVGKKCPYCSRPAVEGRSKCAKHLEYNRLKMREYRSLK